MQFLSFLRFLAFLAIFGFFGFSGFGPEISFLILSHFCHFFDRKMTKNHENPENVKNGHL